MYKLRHFGIEEFVPKEFFEANGPDRSLLVIDERILKTADQLREEFGPTFINTWAWEHDEESVKYRNESGLRIPGQKYYRDTSQHAYGRAVDCIFNDHSAQEVRAFIKRNPDKFPYIMFIEDGVSWLHCDVRNCKRITFWDLNTKRSYVTG